MPVWTVGSLPCLLHGTSMRYGREWSDVAVVSQGFTPDKLPSRACHSVPVFALPNPISKLLQKAAKVLFRGLPCQEPRAGGSSGRVPPCSGLSLAVPVWRHGSAVSPSR